MTTEQDYRDTYATEYRVLQAELAHIAATCQDCRNRFQKDVDEMYSRLRVLEEHDAKFNGHFSASVDAQKDFFVKLGILFSAVQGVGVMCTVALMIWLR